MKDIPAIRRPVAKTRAGGGPRRWLKAVRNFFGTSVWDVDSSNQSRFRRGLYRTSRIVFCTAKSFVAQRRTFQAAALTYYATLSIVPFLAFSFAVVKGFGGYQKLVDDMLRPYVQSTFAGNQPLIDAIEGVLGFVQQTDFATLGVVGLLTLVYSAVSLLSTVEQSLNDIWEVRSARPLLRRITDYVTLLVITPLLILAAGSLAAASSTLLTTADGVFGLGNILRALFRLTSVVVACGVMVALYIIMPNTRIKVSSAIIGGVVSGVLWQLALFLQVNSQRAVANYNALYSGFSAIPIFLFWMYLSWLIVLIGAELASNHQHEQLVRQRMRAREADQALKEMIAVEAAGRIANAFIVGGRRWTATTIAADLGAPLQTTGDVIDALVNADLLVRVAGPVEPEYAPSRPLEDVRVKQLLDAVRHDKHQAGKPPRVEAELRSRLGDVLRALDEEVASSEHNLTLRALGELASAEVKTAPAPEATAGMTAGGYREYANEGT